MGKVNDLIKFGKEEIMDIAALKQELHEYIDNGDRKLLRMLFAIAKEYNDLEYEFTADDIKELDERRQKRLNGETELYTWEQAKEMIINNSVFNKKP